MKQSCCLWGCHIYRMKNMYLSIVLEECDVHNVTRGALSEEYRLILLTVSWLTVSAPDQRQSAASQPKEFMNLQQ